MDGSSRTRKPSLLQTSWVEDDGVCVPHPKKDLPIGTVRSIEKQAGIRFK